MPRELTPGRARRLARLADAGIPLIGQTRAAGAASTTTSATLEQLMRALVAARVKPYYLHHPDLVRGTGHFRVAIERGQALMKALARPPVGPGPADLCARRARRPRQGADRPRLSRRRSRCAHRSRTPSASRIAIRLKPSSRGCLLPHRPPTSPRLRRRARPAACRPSRTSGSRAPGRPLASGAFRSPTATDDSRAASA